MEKTVLKVEIYSKDPIDVKEEIACIQHTLDNMYEDGKTLVDLRGANARRLVQLGVPEGQIDVSDECTICSHEKYWSHRWTKGRRGGQCAGIVLPSEKV